ncbi:DUF2938 domain-containing protein [Alphaproteobacteria bacterium]|nr:DUF2938 domain-containing protein [Alphaproteobacteria bacterium]|tara:strand:+ start:2973 stop:3452 length:480 start_codon:yes stop_codon:yes gene_type:complete
MVIFHILFVGLLSCLVMDLWQRLVKLTYGINPSDWGVIGRWLIMLILKQKVLNPNIENEKPYKNELIIGWIFHYFVAILYSLAFFILIYYFEFLEASFYDGLIFGLITVIIPWFIFLPILGKGILAVKTPKPILVCSLSVWSHVAIGTPIGLLYQFLGY